MFLIQSRSKAIFLQILYRPLDELRDVLYANHFPRLTIRGDEVVENRSEITGTTAYVEDSGAGF